MAFWRWRESNPRPVGQKTHIYKFSRPVSFRARGGRSTAVRALSCLMSLKQPQAEAQVSSGLCRISRSSEQRTGNPGWVKLRSHCESAVEFDYDLIFFFGT